MGIFFFPSLSAKHLQCLSTSTEILGFPEDLRGKSKLQKCACRG